MTEHLFIAGAMFGFGIGVIFMFVVFVIEDVVMKRYEDE